jgi:Acyl-CoA dehydrogenase, N-terminal domain
MTWSERYVGREYSMLESHVVTEELPAADAPVGAHWIVDRQSAPLLLRYGSEQHRPALLFCAEARLRGERRQRVEVRQRLPVRVQRLNADMARPRVELGLNALSNRRFIAPGDHGVEKPVASPVYQILVAASASRSNRRSSTSWSIWFGTTIASSVRTISCR